jgi:hypothetical protein
MLKATATSEHQNRSITTHTPGHSNCGSDNIVSELITADLCSLPDSQPAGKEAVSFENCSLQTSEPPLRDKTPDLSLCRLLAAHFGYVDSHRGRPLRGR